MKKSFVDTNIFLRFLLADHPKQSPACRKLFEKATKDKLILITLSTVILEIGWVLSSFYKLSKREVSEKLKTILLFENLEIPDKEILLLAVEIFEKKNIDLLDAYVASWIKNKKIENLCSFDRDFDKIEGISRIEP